MSRQPRRRFDPALIRRRNPSELERLTSLLVDGVGRMAKQLRSIDATDAAHAAKQREIWQRSTCR